MRLYLVQHGEALTKDVDPDRPLSESGQADVRRLADHLRKCGVRVARVLHSGKTRAKQTAETLAAAIGPEAESDAVSGLDPNDPVVPFAQLASRWDDDALVVGHLPFMDRLVTRLVTGREEAGVVAFRPGSMVCLEPADDRRERWGIVWMLRPERLT